MISTSDLTYDNNGLIPAIVVDFYSGNVLMMAYMNKESLQISMDEGTTCFWSRSRSELWRKGATSGNVQYIRSIKTDCDKDTLLISVEKDGPACHTGHESCFYQPMFEGHIPGKAALDPKGDVLEDGEIVGEFSLEKLYALVLGRKASSKPGSYTTYLFDKGIDKILKKVGEETTEVVIAAKGNDKQETIYEISDLIYHTMVLMAQMDITPEDIKKELASRHK